MFRLILCIWLCWLFNMIVCFVFDLISAENILKKVLYSVYTVSPTWPGHYSLFNIKSISYPFDVFQFTVSVFLDWRILKVKLITKNAIRKYKWLLKIVNFQFKQISLGRTILLLASFGISENHVSFYLRHSEICYLIACCSIHWPFLQSWWDISMEPKQVG